jgi:uncharacterized protein
MEHSVEDEGRSMEAALAAIRRVFAEQDVSETTLARVKQRTSGEEVKTKHGAELLSREATVAISSAIDTLAKTVKKQEPTLEEVVREALRPMLNSWVDENLPDLVERMVRAEIERAIRGH